ncbi:protein of unknown function [Streptantibioticus cattleyicolor NRRL 8057 = DSM 46488]|nr:protein of unknown function [Streptantibioticus cattleyicolor NRRL 8057 = DSM 46488]
MPSFVVLRGETDSTTASKAIRSPVRSGRRYSCSQSVATTEVKPAASSSRRRASKGPARSVCPVSPAMVHTWSMVGGAVPSGGGGWPIASHQCLIMGALTGSLPWPRRVAGAPSYALSRSWSRSVVPLIVRPPVSWWGTRNLTSRQFQWCRRRRQGSQDYTKDADFAERCPQHVDNCRQGWSGRGRRGTVRRRTRLRGGPEGTAAQSHHQSPESPTRPRRRLGSVSGSPVQRSPPAAEVDVDVVLGDTGVSVSQNRGRVGLVAGPPSGRGLRDAAHAGGGAVVRERPVVGGGDPREEGRRQRKSGERGQGTGGANAAHLNFLQGHGSSPTSRSVRPSTPPSARRRETRVAHRPHHQPHPSPHLPLKRDDLSINLSTPTTSPTTPEATIATQATQRGKRSRSTPSRPSTYRQTPAHTPLTRGHVDETSHPANDAPHGHVSRRTTKTFRRAVETFRRPRRPRNALARPSCGPRSPYAREAGPGTLPGPASTCVFPAYLRGGCGI